MKGNADKIVAPTETQIIPVEIGMTKRLDIKNRFGN